MAGKRATGSAEITEIQKAVNNQIALKKCIFYSSNEQASNCNKISDVNKLNIIYSIYKC